jgi:hypothetical protein
MVFWIVTPCGLSGEPTFRRKYFVSISPSQPLSVIGQSSLYNTSPNPKQTIHFLENIHFSPEDGGSMFLQTVVSTYYTSPYDVTSHKTTIDIFTAVKTNLKYVTDSMEQGPWETTFAQLNYLSSINPKAYSCVHNSPPLTPIQFTHSHLIYFMFILLLSLNYVGHPSGLLTSDCPTTILFAFLSTPCVVHAQTNSSSFIWPC